MYDKLAQILGAESTSEQAILQAARSMADELAATKEAFADYRQEAEENEAERMISAAIDSGKFPPMKREALEALADESGIDALRQTIELVPSNAAGPREMGQLEERSTEEQDELIKQARAEGKAVAMDEEEAEFYRTAGKDFVHIDEIDPGSIRQSL